MVSTQPPSTSDAQSSHLFSKASNYRHCLECTRRNTPAGENIFMWVESLCIFTKLGTLYFDFVI